MTSVAQSPRRARIFAIGLFAAALSVATTSGVASAQYPPEPNVSVTCNYVAPNFQYAVTTNVASTATLTWTNPDNEIVGPLANQPLTGSLASPAPGGWSLVATIGANGAQYSAFATCTAPGGESGGGGQVSPEGGATTPQALKPRALPDTGSSGTGSMITIAAATVVAGGAITFLASRSRRNAADSAS